MKGTGAKKVKPIAKPKAVKKGVATQSFPNNAPALFAKRPKVPEADNVGRKFLPSPTAKRLRGKKI